MKVSRDGILPQAELGPRLGGLKRLVLRSSIIRSIVTMLSAMSAAWSTTPVLRSTFANSFPLFMAIVVLCMGAWMVFDYSILLPSEQTFNQVQSQRADRSPLKRDTEEIKKQVNDHRSEVER